MFREQIIDGTILTADGLVNCSWKVNLHYQQKEDKWKITLLIDEHTCIGSPVPTRSMFSKAPFISTQISRSLDLRSNISLKQSQQAMLGKCGVKVQEKQISRALIRLRDTDEASFDLSWSRTTAVGRSFLQSMKIPVDSSIPSSSAVVVEDHTARTDGKFTFQRIFFGPYDSNNIWNNCFRFLSLDGAHLRSRFKTILQVTAIRDGNNEVYPLAWALTESENEDSWRWLLNNLLRHTPSLGHSNSQVLSKASPVVISDRDKGLLAADELLTGCHRAYCCFHIRQNMTQRFGRPCGIAFMQAACAATERDLNTALDEIAKISSACVICIRDIPKESGP